LKTCMMKTVKSMRIMDTAAADMKVRIVSPALGLPYSELADTHIVLRATRPIMGTLTQQSTEFAGGNFFLCRHRPGRRICAAKS